MIQKTRLLPAKVWHLRERPKRNEFTYSVYYVAHRLKSGDAGRPKLLSFNSFNIFSLYNKDLGPKDGRDWLPWIQEEFQKHGVFVEQTDEVEVITHPRLFGYAFNPISFWILLNEQEEIKAVLCEVHNTFKDHHNYIIKHDDLRPIQPSDVFEAKKNLYVSPFNTMEGHYTFSFKRDERGFKTDIIYYKDESSVVKTAMAGSYQKLTSGTILASVARYPLMTVMVVVRIHWQAVKLFAKKVAHTLGSRPKESQRGTTEARKIEPNNQ